MGAGAVLGIVMFAVFRGSFLTPLWETYVAFRTDTDHKTLLEVLSGFVLQSLLLWGVLALFGSSAVGTWLLHPAVLLKCAGSAALAAFFLTGFGTGGVGYYFLTVFPGKLLFYAALLMEYSTALTVSKRIRLALKGEGAFSPEDVRRYTAIIAVCGLLFLLGAVIDALTVTFFSGVFQLHLY